MPPVGAGHYACERWHWCSDVVGRTGTPDAVIPAPTNFLVPAGLATNHEQAAELHFTNTTEHV